MNSHLNDKKIIQGWAMYDWANSVYNLIITTTFFPVYYISVTSHFFKNSMVPFLGFNIVNSALYDYAISFSYFIITLIVPTLSALADYYKNKLLYLRIFSTIGSIACAGLYFFSGQNIATGIFCLIFATMGYAGSIVFYNSYLPDIASPENQDQVSAKGYIYGYIGSIIVQIVGIILLFTKPFNMSEGDAVRITFLIVGIWWFVFAQYSFSVLKKISHEVSHHKESLQNIIKKSYLSLFHIGQNIFQNKSIKYFLFAFFFYNMGVQTVMIVAISFGQKVLNIPPNNLITIAILIQFVAILGAWVTSKVAQKTGNIIAIILIVSLWIAICISAYFISKDYHFYILALVVGFIMGAIQSMSRSTFSKLMPPTHDTTSYFSFYDVVEKLTIVFGIFLFGFVEHITNNMRNSILLLIIFFIIGLGFLFSIKNKKQ